MELNSHDFHFLAEIIKSYSGIALEEDKGYLLQGRLLPIAKKYGLANLSEFVEYTKENQNESLLVEIIEAMTTNESFFYRDEKVFRFIADEFIYKILENCSHKKTLRIWSSACSTGQEAYTAAIAIMEKKVTGLDFEIVATDLDFNVVEKAKEGLYTQFEVQRGMPIGQLVKYFTQESDQWRVKDSVREKIKFEKFNLLDNPSGMGTFDIIFCRNVLIYFESQTKLDVINNIGKCMNANSVLFLGSTEGMAGTDAGMQPVKNNSGNPISGAFTLA